MTVEIPTPFEHRVERYSDLGFSADEAARLAEATSHAFLTDGDGQVHVYEFPLHHLRVKTLMAAGCTRLDILRIFA